MGYMIQLFPSGVWYEIYHQRIPKIHSTVLHNMWQNMTIKSGNWMICGMDEIYIVQQVLTGYV